MTSSKSVPFFMTRLDIAGYVVSSILETTNCELYDITLYQINNEWKKIYTKEFQEFTQGELAQVRKNIRVNKTYQSSKRSNSRTWTEVNQVNEYFGNSHKLWCERRNPPTKTACIKKAILDLSEKKNVSIEYVPVREILEYCKKVYCMTANESLVYNIRRKMLHPNTDTKTCSKRRQHILPPTSEIIKTQAPPSVHSNPLPQAILEAARAAKRVVVAFGGDSKAAREMLEIMS